MLEQDIALSALATTAVQYSLIFVNHSTQTGSACVYQQDPDIGIPDVMSLAWFSKRATPTSIVTFQWTIDYYFVWSETGTLAPGVTFVAAQRWPADLSSTNKVSFTKSGGAYSFANQAQGPGQGNLYITEDGTIPPNQASVGIGMSGFGTFAVQAQPNMNLIFTPHPQYWIAFGNYSPGQVLDISEMNNPEQIIFEPNTYSMTATLNRDNSWTIVPTSQANAQFLKARSRHPQLQWGEDPQSLQQKQQQGRLAEESQSNRN